MVVPGAPQGIFGAPGKKTSQLPLHRIGYWIQYESGFPGEPYGQGSRFLAQQKWG